MQFATRNCLIFEPKMGVDVTATGSSQTPVPMRPSIGPLANLRNKPAKFVYMLRLSEEPAAGQATLRLKTEGQVIYEVSVSLAGSTLLGDRVDVDLASVAGQSDLIAECDVTTATGGAETATLDAALYVDQPLTVTGC